MATYQALLREAMARNTTVAHLLAGALDEYLKKTGEPRLLTEGGS